MKKVLVFATMAMFVSVGAKAHDGGHGPKLSATGKYGGLVSPVVAKSDSSKGSKAAMVHKAELVRGADGSVSFYLYDNEMNPLDLKAFNARGSATIGSKVKGKWKTTPFELAAKDKSFEGKLPKPESKPYSVDVTVTENGKDLLSAFDNLD